MNSEINFDTKMCEDFPKVIFNEEQISARIKEVGNEITKDFADKQKDGIVMLSILKGAALFMVDLMRACDLKLEIDFMVASSYHNDFETCGKVDITRDITCDIKGKHIIIAEDVVDTGKTLTCIKDYLMKRGAASVTIVAFLHKHLTEMPLDVEYVCFDCPDEFVIGYGLDYLQYYRNLPYVSGLQD